MCGIILTKLWVVVLIAFEYYFGSSYALNFSPKPNLVIPFPKLKTKEQRRSSYFGFSIVMRESSIFIGAPRAQSNLTSQLKLDEPGAIFKCTFNITDFSELKSSCDVFPIDVLGNIEIEEDAYAGENRTFQWLGFSMDGSTSENEPILICAPHFRGIIEINRNTDYLHGVCYWTKPTDINANVTQIKALNKKERQINGDFSMGQQGFSAHVKVDNSEFLMGAPGISHWRGSIVRYSMNSQVSIVPEIPKILLSDSYFGYAVSSGNFNSNNINHYVATAPHSKDNKNSIDYGKAYIFEVSDTPEVQFLCTLTSEQYGDMFGYAVLVEDLNSDGLDDIIVSAPLYKDTTMEVGAIYVYMNKKNFVFDLQIIVSPFKSNITAGRFGTSLSKLGDINKDGYKDIVVGAPFINNNRGAVAIYLGSSNGLSKTPSQILEAPKGTQMFGHALSKGVDIDKNDFIDLAVGAPDSGLVFIYRSYPVVDIGVEIFSDKEKIFFNESSFDIEYCWHINSPNFKMKNVEIMLNIELDTKYRRINGTKNGNKNTLKKTVNASASKMCERDQVSVLSDEKNVYKPIELKIEYSLVSDGNKYTGKDFCTKCAISQTGVEMSNQSIVKYDIGCKGSNCSVDLQITELKLPSYFTLGVTKILKAEFFIKNKNIVETGFNEVTISGTAPFFKIPPNCKEDKSKLLCSIASGRGFSGNETLSVEFNVQNIFQREEFVHVTATVTCDGIETYIEDNTVKTSISILTEASIIISTDFNQTYIKIHDAHENLYVPYIFEFHNIGPSSLSDINVRIVMPIGFENFEKSENLKQSIQKSKIFINSNDSYASPVKDNVYYYMTYFESSPNTTLSETIRNRMFSSTEYLPIIEQTEKNNTVSIYSNQTKDTHIAMAKIPIIDLKEGQTLKIAVFISVSPHAVRQFLNKKFDYLSLYPDVFLEPYNEKSMSSSFFNITKTITPIILVNITPPSTPFYFYIVACVGGLIALLGISFVLKKYGFFKRQTKEDMEELLNDKLEKARMRIELDRELSRTEDIELLSTDDEMNL